MNRRLLIVALALVALFAGLVSYLVYSGGRGAEPRRAATAFVELSSGYDPSAESPRAHLQAVQARCTPDLFSRNFADGAYLKGLAFTKDQGATVLVQITKTTISRLSTTNATLVVSFKVTTSSIDQSSTVQKEDTLGLTKLSGTWKVSSLQERYLHG
jgi:hypothetical protein